MRKKLVELAEERAIETGFNNRRFLPLVLAIKDEIKEGLNRGYTLHWLWLSATENKIFPGCYNSFRKLWNQVNDENMQQPTNTTITAENENTTPAKQEEKIKPLSPDEALLAKFVVPSAPAPKSTGTTTVTQYKGTGNGIPKSIPWNPDKDLTKI